MGLWTASHCYYRGATIFILSIQSYFSRKKHQVQGLLEAFKILDNDTHRTYRKSYSMRILSIMTRETWRYSEHPTIKMQLPTSWQILI